MTRRKHVDEEAPAEAFDTTDAEAPADDAEPLASVGTDDFPDPMDEYRAQVAIAAKAAARAWDQNPRSASEADQHARWCLAVEAAFAAVRP